MGTGPAEWYAREAQVHELLPEDVPAARLHWHDRFAGHVVLCFDAVCGRLPQPHWSRDELDAAHAAAAAALADPPPALCA